MSPECGSHREHSSAGRPGRVEACRTDQILAGAQLAWLVALVLVVTWEPFVLRGEPARLTLQPPTSWQDVAGNLLLLAPIGAALAVLTRGRLGSRRRLAVAGTCFGLSAAIEVGQLAIAGRFASPYDVALNTLGAAAAQALVDRLLDRGWSGARLLPLVSLLVLAGTLLYVGISAWRVQRGFRLAGWDAGYAVLAGDELGGGRAYAGEVRETALCAGAGATRVCVEPGAPPEARQALAALAERTQHVEASALVRSESDEQVGPARIVTFSDGLYARNLTLGQAGRDLVLRVRTPLSGPGGTRPELRLAGAVSRGQSTRVTARFDRGRVVMAAEAAGERVEGVIEPTLWNAWAIFAVRESEASYPVVYARSVDRVTALTAALVLAPVAIAAGTWLRHRCSGGER